MPVKKKVKFMPWIHIQFDGNFKNL